MRLTLTLARSNSEDDIAVTADAAATIAEVAAAIARADPRGGWPDPDGYTLQASLPGHGEMLTLPPDAPLGESWIGSGATVRLVSVGTYYSAPNGGGPTIATVRISTPSAPSRTLALVAGSYVIGRDPASDIVVDDRLVSKRHVRLEVGDTVEAVDLGSANGLDVDGGVVTRVRVSGSAIIGIGDTQLEITLSEQLARSGAAPTAGPVYFNRSPRVEARYPGRDYRAPEPPRERDPQPFPLLAMLAPVLMGGAMFVLTRSPFSLIFMAMSPMMMIGNFVTAKQREKRRLRKSIERFDVLLEQLDDSLGRERISERERRLAEAPSTAEVMAAADSRAPTLWTRRPEHWSFGNLRLGTGAMPSRVTVTAREGQELLPVYQERVDELVERNLLIDDVPLVDNLHDAGALGVAGPAASTAEVLNSYLVQLTGLHSPAELVLCALVSPEQAPALDWLKWLPHTSSPHSPVSGVHLADSASSQATLLSELEGLVATRLADRRARSTSRGAIAEDDSALERGSGVGSSRVRGVEAPLPAVVVLITDTAGAERARLVSFAEGAADAGVYPIWVSESVPALPAVCRTFVDVGADVVQAGFVRIGHHVDQVAVEPVTSADALGYARRLAAVIDAGAAVADASDLPRSVSLLSLLGHDLAETSEAVVDRWQQNSSIHERGGAQQPAQRRPGRLRATVGSSGVDAMHLDLREQGPHALVGGTTGSGKSEFLQAWVLGMAAEYSPDRVTFLFVDYKGGSAFADCVALPHCVGLVTDLSPHLVRRALTSLRAELHFREHLLNRKKAKDLIELERRGDPDSPPALVLVIDEFAALVGEVPEFVDGVVDIAQRGRSLGIHLIMATQRPAGVIKDNLRANTNLRVALRVADEGDSQDVVGVKDAAHFDPGLPGRGLAKTGPGRLNAFQSAYAGGWSSREPERAEVAIVQLRFGGELRWEEPSTADEQAPRDPGPNDQQRLVASIAAASGRAAIPAPRRPWLDELAAVYDLARLRQRSDADLLIGVADIPERQEQTSVYFRPDQDGHLAVFGTGGSGKSTVLRALASAAAITPRGGPVHVYGIDFGAGSLRMLGGLPHVGSVVSGDDVERVTRLFRMLDAELERRGALFAEADAASITEYRRVSGNREEPRILLLIDGYPAFRDDWEVPAARSAAYGVFQDIIADGRQLGIHVVLTADRPGAVPTAVSSAIQRRVVLRLADEGMYTMLGVAADVLSLSSPPGRAVVDGSELQVAVLGGSATLGEQAAATRELAEAMRRAGVHPAPEIRSMPREYPQSELPARATTGGPVLGIGDEALEPVPFPSSGTMLVSGPPSSGRTNALSAIVNAVTRFDAGARLFYIGQRRSPLASDPRWERATTTVEDAAALARDLVSDVAAEEGGPRIVVIVEALGDYLQGQADAPLLDLIRAVKRSEHLLIAEAENSAWTSAWPLFAEVKNARVGFLLQPETIEGDLIVKTAFPRMARSEFPVGRGVLVAAGRIQRVQLPIADPRPPL